jgi:hypothetical protein
MQPSTKCEDLAQNLFHSVSLDIHSWSFLVKIESHGIGGGLNAEVNSQQRCGSRVACAPKLLHEGHKRRDAVTRKRKGKAKRPFKEGNRNSRSNS